MSTSNVAMKNGGMRLPTKPKKFSTTTMTMNGDVPLLKPFQSLQGKIDSALLVALKDMKFENMSPVQQKVMEMLPTVGSDW